MNNVTNRSIQLTAVIGAILISILVIIMSFSMFRGSAVSTDQAVERVSEFYLRELADRRAQVISSLIDTKVDQMQRAMQVISKEDLESVDSLRSFIGEIQTLYALDVLALADEDNVVYSLFEEGQKERVHYKVSVMYDLVQKWYEKGYTTTESLKDFFEYRDRKDGVEALVKKKLSIKRNLRESELNSINSWIDILGADEAIVEYAIACLEWRDNIRISDIGNKIKEWFDAGVMSIDKAMLYEKERERENKAKSGSTRSRGRANLRKTGREAGITAASASSGEAKTEPAKEETKEETKEEPKEEVKPAAAPVHDSILDMFSGDDDEDDI